MGGWLSAGWFGGAIGLVGAAVGLLGLALALLEHRRHKIGNRLWYQAETVCLVDEGFRGTTPTKLRLRYGSRSIPIALLTRMVIWNAGTSVLTGETVVESDPLRICVCESAEVLEVRIVRATRHTNGLTVEQGCARASSVTLAFDYLEPRDGCVVELLHTSRDGAPRLIGSLKGVPRGPEDKGSQVSAWPGEYRQLVTAVRWSVLALGFMCLQSFFLWAGAGKLSAPVLALIGLMLLPVGYVAFVSLRLWLRLRRRRPVYPRELGAFDERVLG